MCHAGVGGAIATGRKLAHVGIDADASGFDAKARTDIILLAAGRALRGEPLARATYFGDGAWNLRASVALGYDFIAVGGGAAHDVAFDEVRDTETIVALPGVACVVA